MIVRLTILPIDGGEALVHLAAALCVEEPEARPTRRPMPAELPEGIVRLHAPYHIVDEQCNAQNEHSREHGGGANGPFVFFQRRAANAIAAV